MLHSLLQLRPRQNKPPRQRKTYRCRQLPLVQFTLLRVSAFFSHIDPCRPLRRSEGERTGVGNCCHWFFSHTWCLRFSFFLLCLLQSFLRLHQTSPLRRRRTNRLLLVTFPIAPFGGHLRRFVFSLSKPLASSNSPAAGTRSRHCRSSCPRLGRIDIDIDIRRRCRIQTAAHHHCWYWAHRFFLSHRWNLVNVCSTCHHRQK